MTRTILTPALALGAALALGGVAAAADDSPARASVGGFTMTLGGQGTAAQAAAEDTELTHGRRRGYGGYYGGYRNYYGGFGYGYGGWGYGRGWGYGYRPYWGGYSGGFRPYYGYGWGGYRPYYYSSFRSYYSSPFVGYYGGFGYGYGNGFLCISGTKDDASAPVISLGLNTANNPFVPREAAPAANEPGTLRYDGGPANPVPLPKPEAAPAGGAVGLPVSLPKTGPASPYTYKAYGEK